MKERIMNKMVNGELLPVWYENEAGYFEQIEYDDLGRIIMFKTPDGVEEWGYFKDTPMYSWHKYANGVIEEWSYDFARRPVLFQNNLGLITHDDFYYYGSGRDVRERQSTANENGMVVIHHTNGQPMLAIKYRDPSLRLYRGAIKMYNQDRGGKYINNYPSSVLLGTDGNTIAKRTEHFEKCRVTGTIFDKFGDIVGKIKIDVNSTIIDIEGRMGYFYEHHHIVKDTITQEVKVKESSKRKISFDGDGYKSKNPRNKIKIGASYKGKPLYDDGFDEPDVLPHSILEAIREYFDGGEEL